jgi:hypothetical protein
LNRAFSAVEFFYNEDLGRCPKGDGDLPVSAPKAQGTAVFKPPLNAGGCKSPLLDVCLMQRSFRPFHLQPGTKNRGR